MQTQSLVSVDGQNHLRQDIQRCLDTTIGFLIFISSAEGGIDCNRIPLHPMWETKREKRKSPPCCVQYI